MRETEKSAFDGRHGTLILSSLEVRYVSVLAIWELVVRVKCVSGNWPNFSSEYYTRWERESSVCKPVGIVRANLLFLVSSCYIKQDSLNRFYFLARLVIQVADVSLRKLAFFSFLNRYFVRF